MKIARLMQDGNETYGLIKDGNVATKENITSETGVPLPLGIMDFLFEGWYDEISISTKTFITELKNGEIKNYEISPDNFGIKKHNIAELSVYNINESLTMMKSVLDNNDNAAKAIVSINAGAAIYAAGISDSIKDGIDKALDVIESGAAKKKLEMLIQHSQSFNASWL